MADYYGNALVVHVCIAIKLFIKRHLKTCENKCDLGLLSPCFFVKHYFNKLMTDIWVNPCQIDQLSGNFKS